MMHPSLYRLIQLQLRGTFRKLGRSLKTPKKAIPIVVVVLWLGLMLVPQFIRVAMVREPNPAAIQTYFPLAMAAIFLMTLLTAAGEKVIVFSQSEVDFLFAGPFGRRQLLVYKFLKNALGALFPTLMFTLFIIPYTPHIFPPFAAIWLSLVMFQLLSTIAVLVKRVVAERAYTRFRKLVLAAVLAGVALVLLHAFRTGAEQGFLETLTQLKQSWAGVALLGIFDVFGRTAAAASLFPEFVGWGSLALGIDAVLLWVVLRLDGDYLEAALHASQKHYKLIQRAQRGAGSVSASKRTTVRRSLPSLPWWGGAGPLIWRQMTHFYRNSGTALGGLLIVTVVVGPMVSVFVKGETSLAAPIMGILAYVTLIMSFVLPLGFRADLPYMEWLKNLPVRPIAVVVGEVMQPVLFATLVHSLLVVGIGIFDVQGRPVLAWALLFALPYNLLVMGVQNTIFLLFPVRHVQAGTADFGTFGKQMMGFLAVFAALLVACGIAGGVGGLTYWLFGESWVLGLATAWVTLTIAAAATLPGAVWAFQRFDVGADMPM